MDVRFTLSGTYTFPEGSKFVEGVNNQIELPNDKGVVSVHPILEYSVSGNKNDDHVDLTTRQAEKLGISEGDYNRTTQDITLEVARGNLTLRDLRLDAEFSYRGMDVRNRITDIGTRTATYIRLDQDDPRNYNGPPYSIVEHVLDEDDIQAVEKVYINDILVKYIP